MSNLKLPTMTYDALAAAPHNHNAFGSNQRTIAYATTAECVESHGSTDDHMIVRHHGSVIAEIARGWVYVTNAGYESATTRGRIHKILVDNKQDYGFLVLGQNKGDQVLSFRRTDETPQGRNADGTVHYSYPDVFEKDRELTRSFYSAHWDFENRTVDIRIGIGALRTHKVTL